MRIGSIIVHPTLGPVEVIAEPAVDVIGADGFEHHLGAEALEACYPASPNEMLRYWIARCHNAEGRDVPQLGPFNVAGTCRASSVPVEMACGEAVPDGLPKDIAKPQDPRAQQAMGEAAPYWRNGASRSPAAQAYRDVERVGQLRPERVVASDVEAHRAACLEAAAAEQGFGLVNDAGPATIVLREHGLLGALGIRAVMVDTLGVSPSDLPRGRYVYAGE